MRYVLFALAVIASSVAAFASSDAELIAETTAALPGHLAAKARVVVTDADGKERVLRAGSNGFVCRRDLSSPGFRTVCRDRDVERYRKDVAPVRARASSAPQRLALIEAAIEQGQTTPPVPGSRVYLLSGPDRESAKLLLAIFLPWATGDTTGLPTERTDGTWLMCPGAPNAHIMVGDIPHGQDEDEWKACGRQTGETRSKQ
jgi:hypothetical protein